MKAGNSSYCCVDDLRHQRFERGHILQFHRRDQLLNHGCGGVTFHHGLTSARSIVIRADGLKEFLEVEVLVLKGVGQLVSQYEALHVRLDPVGDEHGLTVRIVKAGSLFGVEADEELLEIEVRRDKAESQERRFLDVNLLRRHFRVKGLRKVLLDFRPADDLLLQR